jgi:hypothetical protein
MIDISANEPKCPLALKGIRLIYKKGCAMDIIDLGITPDGVKNQSSNIQEYLDKHDGSGL